MFSSLVGFGLRPTYILYQYMSSYVRVRIRGVRKVSFSRNFAYVLNGWSLIAIKLQINTTQTNCGSDFGVTLFQMKQFYWQPLFVYTAFVENQHFNPLIHNAEKWPNTLQNFYMFGHSSTLTMKGLIKFNQVDLCDKKRSQKFQRI